MGQRPTIADVARRAGVSRSSVSFALNDRPGLAKETKARILAAAEELGWTPSRPARALSLGKAGAIGLVVTREPGLIGADPFFPAFIAGVESVLAGRGDGLVLHVTPADKERSVYERLAADRRVDGVLLTDVRQDDPRPALLAALGLPAVAVGRRGWADGLCAVELDDQPAFVTAIRRLAELGHRRIAHVEGPQEYRHAQRRRAAWADTLRELGLPEGRCAPADSPPRAAPRPPASCWRSTSRPPRSSTATTCRPPPAWLWPRSSESRSPTGCPSSVTTTPSSPSTPTRP